MARPPTAPSLGEMMYGDHMDAGAWALSIFGSLLLLMLVVLAIVWLVRAQHRANPQTSRRTRNSKRTPGDAV
jgi:hypothetical protein